MKYLVKSDFCGTLVDDQPRTKEEAQALADQLNKEAKELDLPEVTYSIITKN
jgi:hypothetical protein